MKYLRIFLWICLFGFTYSNTAAETGAPILLYHRFGPVVADSMTVTTQVFQSHLECIQESGVKIIPLKDLLEMYFGKGIPSGSRYVALVADDAHISVYTTALPLLKKYRAPMTLFVYPSAISNASYAMTWDQLRELKATGLFDFQSHTYWHPNFKTEKKRLSEAEFQRFVEVQLTKSREKLQKELALKVDLLAWPFGIYEPSLMLKASELGYVAAFTIEPRPVTQREHSMALPRYLMSDKDRGRAFAGILNTSHIH